MAGKSAAVPAPIDTPDRSPSPGEEFVSLDHEANVACIVCENGSGLRWKELSSADGELLANMGARRGPPALGADRRLVLGGRRAYGFSRTGTS